MTGCCDHKLSLLLVLAYMARGAFATGCANEAGTTSQGGPRCTRQGATCAAATGSCICSAPGNYYCSNGVCVQVPTGNVNTAGQPIVEWQCWDVCNANNTAEEFGKATSAVYDVQQAVEVSVQDRRKSAACPGMEMLTHCTQGERCTNTGETYQSGLCVSGATSNVCLNMCSNPIEAFNTPGRAAETAALVQAVKSGNDPVGKTICPGVTPWVWLWVPIVLFYCVMIACSAYFANKFYQTRLKKRGGAKYDEADKMGDPFVDPYDAPYPPLDGDYQKVEQEPMPIVQAPLAVDETAVPMTREIQLEPEALYGFNAVPPAPMVPGYTTPSMSVPMTMPMAPMTMPLAPMTTSMYSQPGYPMGSHMTTMPGYGQTSYRIG